MTFLIAHALSGSHVQSRVPGEMWAVVSVLAFYFAALNIFLARFAGTCTQGDADRLWGVTISILLYGIAIFGLAKSRSQRFTLLTCSPLVFVLLWQVIFAFQFSSAAFQGIAACDVLEGRSGYPPTGDEPALAVLWLSMAILVPLGVTVVVFRRRGQIAAPAESR